MLTGQTGDGTFSRALDVAAAAGDAHHPALGRLWARQRIQLLGDYDLLGESDERRREITSLGLTHHLLTAFTSFVAVDEAVRYAGGAVPTVEQPLPTGVSALAVGSSAATPEPETWMLIVVSAGVLAWHGRRQRRRAAR